MADDLRSTLNEAIGQAIQAAISKYEKGMATHWICLIESLDDDGDRGLWTLTNDEIKAWDCAGMLQHALHLQLAQVIAYGRE